MHFPHTLVSDQIHHSDSNKANPSTSDALTYLDRVCAGLPGTPTLNSAIIIIKGRYHDGA